MKSRFLGPPNIMREADGRELGAKLLLDDRWKKRLDFKLFSLFACGRALKKCAEYINNFEYKSLT